jgi:V/A-type H+-transporting ATPase subunit D
MALKFQYDKTTIQDLNRQLGIRKKALPILQNKETALRKEIRNRQEKLHDLSKQMQRLKDHINEQPYLWAELPEVLFIENAALKETKIIGVKVKELDKIQFRIADFCWWRYPAWFPTGIDILKQVVQLELETDILRDQVKTLEEARKKTTQKVNLYEKVQIPEMEDAILKIKRFLEDKENISKAGQKIMKKKQRERREAL